MQVGLIVTSRSGALRKLILWGHLLASDLDFYDVKPFIFDYDAIDRRHDVLLFNVDRCYWLSFTECAGFWTLRMPRHWWNPLDSGLSQGVCHLGWFIYCAITFDLMIWCGHVLTWLLMMQADDSLPTRLTYGVKGPHTISIEVEGEVWTTALPQPTSTLVVARTVG